MKVKNTIFSILTVLFALAATSAHAQGIKIGLVDMQKALNEYNQTKVRTEKINARAAELKKERETQAEELKVLIEKIKEIAEEVQDTEKNEETRKKSAEKLDEHRLIYMEKQKVASDAAQRASTELSKQRIKMEGELVGAITTVMTATAEEKGLDLVFDKSFLPRANKLIVQVSTNVVDITDEIVVKLNSQ